ncbi:hypothetical protein [Aeromicrobium sp.]|uniref:hypothetical protein n=1 Tax=Aeromicrobium sp. TaxID=1871063 RepID=UPI003D6C34BB
MPTQEYETSPAEVRTFAFLQMGLTAVFLVLLFWAFGGTDARFPPWWIVLLLLLAVAISAFFAERVWLSARPLSPAVDPDELRSRAVGVFAGQIVRKLAYCEASVIFAVIVGFVAPYGGWPMLIGGVPGLALIVFETWPSLRNTSMTEVMLDADGAESGLVESFRSW